MNYFVPLSNICPNENTFFKLILLEIILKEVLGFVELFGKIADQVARTSLFEVENK